MDEVRQRRLAWVKALESGEFRQTKGQLGLGNTVDGFSYCCLGVACELAIQAGVKVQRQVVEEKESGDPFDPDTVVYNGDVTLLPPQQVHEWYDMEDNVQLFDVISWEIDNPGSWLPDLDGVEAREYFVEASELNDANHYTFDQIARCVRVTYELGEADE